MRFNQQGVKNGLATDRATNIVQIIDVSSITLFMHGMSAAQKSGGLACRMQVLLADRTVVVNFFYALMRFLEGLVQAATTSVAVEKVIFSSDAANTALVTVVDPFFIAVVIVQVADVAEIDSEIALTIGARLALGLINSASETLNMGN